MKIAVYHAPSLDLLPFDGLLGKVRRAWAAGEYTLVAEWSPLAGDTVKPEYLLERAWMLTNSIETPWYENPTVGAKGPTRSTSIGDIVTLDGEPHVAVTIGFKALPIDLSEGDEIEVSVNGRSVRGIVCQPFGWTEESGWDIHYNLVLPNDGRGSVGRWKQKQDGGTMKLINMKEHR